MKVSASTYTWDVGKIATGESGSFIIKAKVDEELSGNQPNVVANVGILTETEEKEQNNNSDSDSTDAYDPYGEDGYNNHAYDGDRLDSDLKVTRLKTITGPVAGGEIVYNAIIVKNNGEGPVYDVRVKDQMVDSQKEELVKFTWPIGDLAQDDEILIEYQLQVNANALPGDYQFVAYSRGEDPYEDQVSSGRAILGMNIYQLGGWQYFAQGETVVDDQPPFEFLPTASADQGNVLGISDAVSCLPLPLWIWVSALVAYALAVNWSLFAWKDEAGKKLGKFRGFVVPFVSTLGMVGFWVAYRCDSMLWFMITTFLILLVHLLVKKRLDGHFSNVLEDSSKVVKF
jgi:hypothetical protein